MIGHSHTWEHTHATQHNHTQHIVHRLLGDKFYVCGVGEDRGVCGCVLVCWCVVVWVCCVVVLWSCGRVVLLLLWCVVCGVWCDTLKNLSV